MTAQTPVRRPLAVWLATGALLAAGASVAVHAGAAAPSSAAGAARAGAVAAPIPVVTSENVSLETVVPVPAAISLEFARTGDFAYVSSLAGIRVLDTSDPVAPALRGFLPTVNFENESMTYGERVVDGELRRFVLLAIDLVEAGPQLPGSYNLGGLEIAVVDVTDPDAPEIISRVPATTSTHTAQCVDQLDCRYVYTAGTGGEFSIIDMGDLTAPEEVKTVASPASGPDAAGLFGDGAGHYWDFDGALGWHTGSGGAAAFDVSDPLNPTLVNATNEQGREPGLNDFILHNSMRPNADAFEPGAEPSVENGNVLLVTEEDYANEGDEVVCERAGSFQTWYVPDLDAEAYGERNPDGTVQDVGTIENLDSTTAPSEFGGGISTPASAFCSAHWFDYHQDGFVAQGWYGAGMRILDVRNAREITQVGYATTGATEVWDAYWVPERDGAGVVTGQKTNVLYTADATRGIDVYTVTLPTEQAPGGGDGGSGGEGGEGGGTPTAAPAPPTAEPAARALPETGAGLALPVLSVLLLAGAAVAGRRA